MNYFSNTNKEKDEKLIKLVRCNAVLYDASHSDYKSNVVKHRVWEKISKSLDIPVADVKKRWKHLRDHYMKKTRANSGKGPPRSLNNWVYMSQLTFLSATSQSGTLTNVKHSEETEYQENEEEALSQDSKIIVQNYAPNDADINAMPSTSHVREVSASPYLSRKRKKFNKFSVATSLEKRQEGRSLRYAKLLSQPTISPIHKFFDSIADIVSQFPPHLAAEARGRVFEAVHEIEMKMYDEQLNSGAMASNDPFGNI